MASVSLYGSSVVDSGCDRSSSDDLASVSLTGSGDGNTSGVGSGEGSGEGSGVGSWSV